MVHPQKCRIGIEEQSNSENFHVPFSEILNSNLNEKIAQIEIRISVTQPENELISYNIYVNDVALYTGYGKKTNGTEQIIHEEIELSRGNNKIEVSCLNNKGAESLRSELNISYSDDGKGDLYFIGFGVSNYKDNKLDLKYAHKDAEDLAILYRNLEGSVYNKVHAYTYVDQSCTVESILQAKNILSKGGVDDTVVLFVAGHGLHDFDLENTYYFLTHETNISDLKNTAASFKLLEELLQGIKQRKKLFLIDTCESGEVEPDLEKQYLSMADSRGLLPRSISNQRGLRLELLQNTTDQLIETQDLTINTQNPDIINNIDPLSVRSYLYDTNRYIYNDLVRRSGTIIFSSSKGGEFSYESDIIQNGFFTNAILKAIGDRNADYDANGLISTDELQKYVKNEVSEKTNGYRNPTVDWDNIYQELIF